MKSIKLIAVISFATFLNCSGQQTQRRSITSFNKIQAGGAVTIEFTSADSNTVNLKGKGSDLEKIETKIEGNTLVIASKRNLTGPVTVYVQNPALVGIELSGATEFRNSNQLKTDELTVNASGSGDLKLDVDAKKVSCLLSGASNLSIQGKTEEITAEVTGASSLKAYQLQSRNARITATGASTARVCATDVLKANATGASDIKIKGDPKEVSAEAGGAATITRIRDVAKNSEKKNADTTSYNWKNKKLMIVSGKKCGDDEDCDHKSTSSFKHWSGFYLGVNGYFNAAGSLAMKQPYQFMDLNYSRSFNLQFNLIERQFKLVHDYVKIVTGFGLDVHQYQFSNPTTLNPDTSYTWSKPTAEANLKYLKNKLVCTYIQVPLLLEFNTSDKPEKTFHIGVGVVGEYLIASRTKQVIEQNGDTYKKIHKDNYNLQPFAAKAHLNFGYRGWTVFAEYGLTNLFQAGKGPDLRPFTAGIRVLPFS